MQVEPGGFTAPTVRLEGPERLPQPPLEPRSRDILKEPSPAGRSHAERRAGIDQAVERLNRMADIFATSLRFSVHEATHTIVVRVVNTQTGEVIREIPPEQILNAVAKMQEMLGLLFDAKA